MPVSVNQFLQRQMFLMPCLFPLFYHNVLRSFLSGDAAHVQAASPHFLIIRYLPLPDNGHMHSDELPTVLKDRKTPHLPCNHRNYPKTLLPE